jgi:hypothetical protein
MKTLTYFYHVLAFASAFVAGASAAGDRPAQSDPSAGVLQVKVNVPPSADPLREDDVSREFLSRVYDVFQRKGYRGEIKEVTSVDEPASGSPLLTINLTEWRVDRVGNIDCTFNARLQTGGKTERLGLFNESALRTMRGPGRSGLGDSFNDAAEAAIRDLYDALAKTGQVPGLRAKQR